MEWFEDEALWRELYPYVFPAERVAAAARQVDGILALSGVKDGAVLDLCCGPGRHAVELARRGFAVCGVDRSPYLLERAGERAAEAGVAVEWIPADMREFARLASFNLACNLFTSFGYFAREEDNLRVLANLRASLREGGTLIMDMVGRERVERQGMAPVRTQCPDGATLIQQPRVNGDGSRLASEWTVVKDGASRSYRFEHRLYSGPELRDGLLASGFVTVRLYGDLHGSPYDGVASRLVAVARR